MIRQRKLDAICVKFVLAGMLAALVCVCVCVRGGGAQSDTYAAQDRRTLPADSPYYTRFCAEKEDV